MLDKSGPKHIAVVGAGISGMGAALRLAQSHQVTLYEAEPRLGGHARTRMAGDEPVDTGFIVFNYANYPHMAALFAELDVPVVKSDMSFGASFDGGAYEYGLRSLGAVFAQRRNALRPGHLRMLRDVLRFNRRALAASRRPGLTIGDLLADLGTGDWFRDRYLLPLCAAIWSTPSEQVMEFPAQAMMQFFENHALLHHRGQHQWYTVEGGSQSYVQRLEAALRQSGVKIVLGRPIEALRRSGGAPELRLGGAWRGFDAVVLATHSDDSLAMLADPSPAERSALAKIRYQPNRVVLHSDPSVMPRRRGVWSSWNYAEAPGAAGAPIDLTYWMNSLQPWLQRPLFVTLNTVRPIRADLIHDDTVLRHPVYDLAALEGQREVAALNGAQGTWYCGAWMKNGFHEDGLASALEVVDAMGAMAR